jgi:hypothetical protein
MSIRGFIDRLIGRPRQWVPPQGNSKEHDDWRVGDLAVRTAKGTWFALEDGNPTDGPAFGALLRVTGVRMDFGWHILSFEGVPDWWTAECFQMVRPNQREACTEGFKLRMKGLRPKVDA